MTLTLAQKDLQGDGYTVMDKYLDGLDPTKKIDWSNPQSNVNTLDRRSFKPAKIEVHRAVCDCDGAEHET